MNPVTEPVTKQANAAVDEMSRLNSARINQEYFSLLRNFALGSVAAGGAIRGGQGLVNMIRRNLAPKDRPSSPLSFAVPTGNEPEEPTEAEPTMSLPFGKMSGILGTAWDTAMTPINSAVDWAKGQSADRMSELPQFWAGLGVAGAGGLYAGYNGVGAVMNSRRKAELESEEESARQEYEKSLAGLASKSGSGPASQDEKFAALYQVKEAFMGESGPPNLKQLGAIGLGAWPPLALLSGAVAYNITNSRRQSALMAKAVKARQRQQLADAPPFAYTQDVSPTGSETGGVAEDEPYPVTQVA